MRRRKSFVKKITQGFAQTFCQNLWAKRFCQSSFVKKNCARKKNKKSS